MRGQFVSDPRDSDQVGTHSDKLQHLINEEYRSTEVKYSLPLNPVKRRDGEERLQGCTSAT